MSKLDLDLEAALKAAEARAAEPPPPTTSPLPRAKWRGKAKAPADAEVASGPVRRLTTARSGRVHMFSTRASAETLNALYALARDERRTVTELFEEAVGLLVSKRL
jgi:hypothetical protein